MDRTVHVQISGKDVNSRGCGMSTSVSAEAKLNSEELAEMATGCATCGGARTREPVSTM